LGFANQFRAQGHLCDVKTVTVDGSVHYVSSVWAFRGAVAAIRSGLTLKVVNVDMTFGSMKLKMGGTVEIIRGDKVVGDYLFFHKANPRAFHVTVSPHCACVLRFVLIKTSTSRQVILGFSPRDLGGETSFCSFFSTVEVRALMFTVMPSRKPPSGLQIHHFSRTLMACGHSCQTRARDLKLR